MVLRRISIHAVFVLLGLWMSVPSDAGTTTRAAARTAETTACLRRALSPLGSEASVGTAGEDDKRVLLYKKDRKILGTSVEDKKRYARNRYGEYNPSNRLFGGTYYGEKALASLEALGPKFTDLIVDPGIVFNISGFTEFVKNNNLLRSDPWRARGLYADHLGFATVYRALALTSEEYKTILREGMESTVLRSGEPASGTETDLRRKLVERGSLRDRPRDPFLSVSKYKDVAAAVASSFVTDKSAQKVYVFKLHIPRLDLLYHAPDTFLNGLKLWGEKYVVSVGRSKKSFPVDDRLESFILYKVEPNEILSVSVSKLKYTGAGFTDANGRY
jgi:hypothetical protein